MKLCGLHVLLVDDVELLKSPLTEEGDTENIGNKKNEQVPIARAYRGSGKSQEKIAKEVGVHASTVSRYKSKERNVKRRPSFDSLKRLSKVVGAKATSMFPELSV
jgi:ribosome-binding protein aMBF1 (putative translation factor)